MTKGVKTSEFWLGLLAIVLAYLNKELQLNVPVEVVISTLGLVGSYIMGRSWVKSKQ